MKKKDQESLRKIVIIGLVLVVGYLGSQSMTSDSSPIGEAQVPNECDKVKISKTQVIKAQAEFTLRYLSTDKDVSNAINSLGFKACKKARKLLEESCESESTKSGRNPIRENLEAASLMECERALDIINPDCRLISREGSMVSMAEKCKYDNTIVDYKILGFWSKTDVTVSAEASGECALISEYIRCTHKDLTLDQVTPPRVYPDRQPDPKNGAWYQF